MKKTLIVSAVCLSLAVIFFQFIHSSSTNKAQNQS